MNNYKSFLAKICDASSLQYLDDVAFADRNIEGGASQELLDSPYDYQSDAILAARIPWLCPDCKGTGEIGDLPELRIPSVSCDHPNAPTIADLLRWGELSAKAIVSSSGEPVWIDDGGRYFCIAKNHRMNSYDVASNRCWYCSNPDFKAAESNPYPDETPMKLLEEDFRTAVRRLRNKDSK